MVKKDSAAKKDFFIHPRGYLLKIFMLPHFAFHSWLQPPLAERLRFACYSMPRSMRSLSSSLQPSSSSLFLHSSRAEEDAAYRSHCVLALPRREREPHAAHLRPDLQLQLAEGLLSPAVRVVESEGAPDRKRSRGQRGETRERNRDHPREGDAKSRHAEAEEQEGELTI